MIRTGTRASPENAELVVDRSTMALSNLDASLSCTPSILILSIYKVQAMGDPPPDRRTRKRLATRQTISDVATRLFLDRGFDQVTIDEIAEAADVGRMTVFNHFPRKEDMFFDREQEIRDVAFGAVRSRAAGLSPIDALGHLAHHLIDHPDPSFPLFTETQLFVETAF